MAEDSLVEEFFTEVNDKYYPQVLEGLNLLDAGKVAEAMESIARPLHTIKGVTGFMPGFEEASHFTHKVESYLKKLQAGDVPKDEEHIALAVEGINAVFTVAEQIRDMGAPEKAMVEDLLSRLEGALGGGEARKEAQTAQLIAETRDGVTVLRLGSPRVHLESQRKTVADAVFRAAGEGRVLLDLSGVLTFGSAAWEALVPASAMADLWVCGMNADCKRVFYSWGYDHCIRAVETEADFWAGAKRA